MTDTETERPLVTFALFAYNQEKYIREAVEGAFSQTYEPLEIILSDDCSSDRTFEIMQEMVSEYKGSHSIRLVRNPKNVGRESFGLCVSQRLTEAAGELIVFAAGDDISSPHRTLRLFETWDINGRKAVSLHSRARVVDADGVFLFGYMKDEIPDPRSLKEVISVDGRGVLGATHAIARRVFQEFGPLRDGVPMEDCALSFRSMLLDGVLFVAEDLVVYRWHGNNISAGRELNGPVEWRRYVSGLRCLQHGMLSDYIHVSKVLSSEILESFRCRLSDIERMDSMFSENLVNRVISVWSYGKIFSFKRRVWLLRWVLMGARS